MEERTRGVGGEAARAEGHIAVTKDGLTFAITRFIITGMLKVLSVSGESQAQFIERAARRVEALGLSASAILFLESSKPLAYLGAQILYVTQPFLAVMIRPADLERAAELLQDSAAVEALIQRLENPSAAPVISPG